MNLFAIDQKPPVFESPIQYWKSAGPLAIIHYNDGVGDPLHVGLEVGVGRKDIFVGAIIRLIDGKVSIINHRVPDNARRQYRQPQDGKDWSFVSIAKPVFEAVVVTEVSPASETSAPPVGSRLIAANNIPVIVTGYLDEVFPGGHHKVRVGVRREDGKGLYAVYLDAALGWKRA